MIKKICILLHGPFHENAYVEIFNRISKIKKELLKSISIIVVCYVSDYERTVNIMKNINDINIKIVKVKDVVNPGFFNINRQIVSVRTGLKNIEVDCFVVKLRNDQYINFIKLI
ncbi:WavE lipopolysaccharide synthesis family protein, partial [uncultured Clostridium sp.]|uniref:WavE lipopolysaccharide synthesis family protein n=1 Tax=uncultured Clostridium sp. TaxID=59620 RepID=UPI0025CE2B2D